MYYSLIMYTSMHCDLEINFDNCACIMRLAFATMDLCPCSVFKFTQKAYYIIHDVHVHSTCAKYWIRNDKNNN